MRYFIQYLWIERWRSFENTEINFSSKYHIHYDKEDKELNVSEKNKEYVIGVFGENKEITAIVGMNGAGKTSLCEFLLSFCGGTNPGVEGYGRYIVAYINLDDDSIHIEYHDNDSDALISDSCISKLEKRQISVRAGLLQGNYGDRTNLSSNGIDIRYIYYSGMLNSPGFEYANQTLLTPSHDISNAIEKSASPKDVMRRFWAEVFEKQLHFVSDNHEFFKDKMIDICWPEQIGITVIRPFDSYQRINDFSAQPEDSDKYIAVNSIENMIRHSSRNNSFFVRLGQEMLYSLLIFDRCNEWVVNNREKEVTDKKDIIKMVMSVVEYIKEKDNADYLNTIICFLKEIELIIDSGKLIYSDNMIFYPLADTEGKGLEGFCRFFRSYYNLKGIHSFLLVNWGLSSGEMSMLSIFSQLYDLTEKKCNGKERYLKDEDCVGRAAENAVILLDEAEVTLHPEWQRRFVNNLNIFFDEFYKGSNLQIIIATHSPIILSDIPRQSTVFLRRSKHGITIVDDDLINETFGANVYRIYKNAFFLDSYMGDFVRGKIESILGDVRKLQEKKKENPNINLLVEINELSQRVALLGDSLIKDEIMKKMRALKE